MFTGLRKISWQRPCVCPAGHQAARGGTHNDYVPAARSRPRVSVFTNCGKAKRAARNKPEPKLTRVAFKVSRLMEFCSERELQTSCPHQRL